MRSLLFDLDGTLIDSAPSIVFALNDVFDDTGYAPVSVDAVKPLLAGDAMKLVAALIADQGREISESMNSILTKRFLEMYKANPAQDAALYPGALNVLHHFQDAGHSMAICTNKPSITADPVLEVFELGGFFDAVICGDQTKFKKPDGRHVLETAAAIKGKTDTAVMIGDSGNDIYAAHDAGVASVWAAFGYGLETLEDLRPTATINALDELPAVIADLH